MKHIVSIGDLSRFDIDNIIKKALKIKKGELKLELEDKEAALIFLENSTRTHKSSSKAARRLKMQTTEILGAEGTSVKKGEPLRHTLKMFQLYDSDCIILRHGLDGASRYASEYLDIPIINAGDGQNEHPTQTLLDLMTIFETFGKIDGLKIGLAGDLKYGRTVHSLQRALEKYNIELSHFSPPNLSMPIWRNKRYEKNTEKKIKFYNNFNEIVKNVDVLYMTRIQKERFADQREYNDAITNYHLNAEMVSNSKIKIMHPLPMYKDIPELALNLEKIENQLFFEQAKNGVPMRMAIIHQLFNEGFQGNKSKIKEYKLWQDLPLSKSNQKPEDVYRKLDFGTAIDHLEPQTGIKLLKMLGYQDSTYRLVGNVQSRFGKKDFLAIHDKYLTSKELQLLGLISSRSTVNLIKNSKVVKKGKILLPPRIDGLLNCPNVKCISHKSHNQNVKSKFIVTNQDPLELTCYYCDEPHGRDKLNYHFEK